MDKCDAKEIINLLKELLNKVTAKANASNTIEIDTSKTDRKIFQMVDVLGVQALHIAVMDVGGGFTIAINNEKEFTASNDYVVEDEDISSLTIIGSGTSGTGYVRCSGYIPRYKV